MSTEIRAEKVLGASFANELARELKALGQAKPEPKSTLFWAVALKLMMKRHDALEERLRALERPQRKP
jgi:hypothetical protein